MLTPGLIALGITASVAVLGVRIPVVLIGVAASTLVAISILQEWIRGTQARHRAAHEAYPIAFLQLLASNRPRYGGYVVHLAIVMLAFGIIGSSFYNIERDVFLSIGESADVGHYAATETTPFADRTERTATMKIYRDGEFLTTLEAWHGVYPSFNMLSTRAGIRSTPVEDLYIIFSELQPDGRTAAFRLLLNPMIWWMWLAGPFVVLGTGIALWPSRQRAAAFVPSPTSDGPVPTGGVS
jgi:cytochrome c-type biogenesis protein CcmF